MQYKHALNTGIAAIGTTLSYLIGGWDSVIKILAVLMVIDYVTGIMKAISNKDLASDVGFRGLMKKAAILFVVILAHQLDLTIPQENPIFRTMACYFYIANEGISITENIALLGVPLPGGIVNMLKKMKDSNTGAGA
ncbi:toxin secretion/phage lysis holin [Anaerosolibacter carboniphilus]|uniref:Toxin secretion/phage lysis holin n=1 Tax=Anaerosolibacter carboniphilus TaxID=1417629 RepID=A0A841L6Z6_9FIRM|nr:phage holin family protein [Anaerosolibacter carboniphilus]MBB6218169.1 toxin secretion/phage lysis holin [Anaerosolibacter carboniphilus]